ncbi:MAG: hypothetical protein AAFW01_10640 [Pseudomonadota bacterium]
MTNEPLRLTTMALVAALAGTLAMAAEKAPIAESSTKSAERAAVSDASDRSGSKSPAIEDADRAAQRATARDGRTPSTANSILERNSGLVRGM